MAKKVIKLTDKIAVKATDKHPTYKPGRVFEIHPNQLAYLIEKGFAVVVKAKEAE